MESHSRVQTACSAHVSLRAAFRDSKASKQLSIIIHNSVHYEDLYSAP